MFGSGKTRWGEELPFMTVDAERAALIKSGIRPGQQATDAKDDMPVVSKQEAKVRSAIKFTRDSHRIQMNMKDKVFPEMGSDGCTSLHESLKLAFVKAILEADKRLTALKMMEDGHVRELIRAWPGAPKLYSEKKWIDLFEMIRLRVVAMFNVSGARCIESDHKNGLSLKDARSEFQMIHRKNLYFHLDEVYGNDFPKKYYSEMKDPNSLNELWDYIEEDKKRLYDLWASINALLLPHDIVYVCSRTPVSLFAFVSLFWVQEFVSHAVCSRA